jgi:Flp pilus assembly protein TadG
MSRFKTLTRSGRLDDERGATLAIVAISLIALFGMVILVVDVGGLLWKRRELVNGSDAAALAAAQTCALDLAESEEDIADQWAIQNVGTLTAGQGGIIADTCRVDSSGYVTVQYTNPQQLFFAPVLGFGASNDVTTRATAIWGPPGAANPMPIVVYANSFNNCRIDADPTPGDECFIWEDNNNTQGSQSGFGFLDLRTDDPARYGWDSVAGATCPNAGADPRTWIQTWDPNDSTVGELPLNYPDPTYVCRLTGLQQTTWSALEDREGEVLFFPINRCDAVLPGNPFGQIASDTSEVACGDTPHQYDIIGFVALRLIEVYRPNEVQGQGGTCDVRRAMQNGSFFNLDALGIADGCFTAAPQVVSNVDVAKAGGPGPQPVECTGLPTPSCDWTYDDANRLLTWNAGGPAGENRNYDITWQWQNQGPCGIPPSGNNSGHCLVVEVVDVQIGGSGPGGGDPNSNLRAVALCNPEISGSCDPVAVP